MDSAKASHYLELLDAARCEAGWSKVPELIRKIQKHALHRECVIITAQTELHISSISGQIPLKEDSVDATTLLEDRELILAAIEKEKDHDEDVFQARICLAWAHSLLGNLIAAYHALPTDLDTIAQQSPWPIRFKWTYAGIMKGAYLRSAAFESSDEGYKASEVVLPCIMKLRALAESEEFFVWSERVIARQCELATRLVESTSPEYGGSSYKYLLLDSDTALKPFRVWAELWDEKSIQAAGPLGHSNDDDDDKDVNRVRIWYTYYKYLSVCVESQVVEPLFGSRFKQGKEYLRVTAVYGRILMNLVRFPRANQATPRMEDWVDTVMTTWRIMISPPWKDEDTGRGGRAGLSRIVIAILYQAATCTFHSMLVMRSLFEVHAYLCEFDLASKALLQYIEIVTKSNARVKKSGKDEPGLDSLDFTMKVATAGVEMLCECGGQKNLESAYEISALVESWVSRAVMEPPARDDVGIPQRLVVSGEALALANYAIGLSKSFQARMTNDTRTRTNIQASAIYRFQTALRSHFGVDNDVKVLYHLSVILAETGDYDGALASVKKAIKYGAKINASHLGSSEKSPDSNDWTDEVQGSAVSRAMLVKCWHLLALLLDSGENWAASLASCEAAFEPYGGNNTLYGNLQSLGTISNMSLRESKILLELKMEHLSLIKLIHGHEAAVNGSYELFALFRVLQNDLKGDLKGPEAKAMESRPASQPNSMGGTHKGLRISILGLPKDRHVSRLSAPGTASNSVGSLEQWAHSTLCTPIINHGNNPLPQVSNHHQGFLGRHESKKLKKRPSRKAMDTAHRSQVESSQKSSSDEAQHQSTLHAALYSADQIGVAMTHDLPSAPSTPAPTSQPSKIPSSNHTAENNGRRIKSGQPIRVKFPMLRFDPNSTTRITPPASLPEPTYPPDLKHRHLLATLSRLWLFTSSLYREASMVPDAHASVDAAKNAVQEFGANVANREGGSLETYSHPGYGGLKSYSELWADVLSEKGLVWLAEDDREGALPEYEAALEHCPDHLDATIGLSSLLLDCYDGTPPMSPQIKSTLSFSNHNNDSGDGLTHLGKSVGRRGARDRAMGLLTTMTKSGQGWNSCGAWHTLARAYEASGQGEKAVDAYEWVVKLVDSGHSRVPWSSLA